MLKKSINSPLIVCYDHSKITSIVNSIKMHFFLLEFNMNCIFFVLSTLNFSTEYCTNPTSLGNELREASHQEHAS